MSIKSLFVACFAVALSVAAPAVAYTLTGTLSPGGDTFYRPISFDRDGNIDLTVRYTSASGFAVDSSSALYYLNLTFYNFYDAHTGEYQGGDDNFGSDAPFQFYGDDIASDRSYTFHLAYPLAQVRRDYVVQYPGDPFPTETGYTETGYTETLLNLYGSVLGNADPAFYTVNVSGSAVVPEPAAWTLLIGGFAMTGAAMRRRRLAA